MDNFGTDFESAIKATSWMAHVGKVSTDDFASAFFDMERI